MRMGFVIQRLYSGAGRECRSNLFFQKNPGPGQMVQTPHAGTGDSA